MLKEKRDAFHPTTVYVTLLAKCAHKGLPPPTVQSFFSDPILAQAQAYWFNDLAYQVRPNLLPPWEQVVTDLETLLTDLLGQGL